MVIASRHASWHNPRMFLRWCFWTVPAYLIGVCCALGEDGNQPKGGASALETLLANYERHITERLKPNHKELTKGLQRFESGLLTRKKLEAAIVVREARISPRSGVQRLHCLSPFQSMSWSSQRKMRAKRQP